ncbi:MAG TPA: hypothetical protein VMJ75_28280 [Candidatus Acidoferrales bacterium]|nr:hypothetical protein [Candidatus Acidoferrales bacterium]
MFSRFFSIFLVTAILVFGAGKKNTGSARGENQDFVIDATIYTDTEAVKEVVGDDLGGHFTVVQVKIVPRFGKEIAIDRDDFMLRTDKDGDRSKPMAPSQIAGRGSLVITGTRGPSGEGAERTRGWSIGGPIGMGSGGVGGGGAVDPGSVKATMEKTADEDSPLKKTLDAKVLPEKKTTEPVSGQLYFPLEKQKLKDLELIYGSKDARISLRFK